MTAAELERLPHDARYELWRGRLRARPFMGGQEGVCTARLCAHVSDCLHDDPAPGIGFTSGTGFYVEHGPDTVLAPDLAFVAKGRLSLPLPKGYIPVIPDLVLETRSPSDRPKAVAEKVQQWLVLGVRLVWEMNPATQIVTVYAPGAEPQEVPAEGTLGGGDILPGFTLPLSRVFG